MLPVFVFDDPNISSIAEVQTFKNVSPTILYDEFMAYFLTRRQEIPFSFPFTAISLCHDLFIRSNRCISTVADHIVCCISHHLQSRISVISMFQDFDWLKEMKLLLITRNMESRDGTYQKSIQALLKYMSLYDIGETGILNERTGLSNGSDPADVTKLTPEQVKFYQSRKGMDFIAARTFINLVDSNNRAYIDNCWFNCLKICRDTFLPKKEKKEFPVSVLWAESRSNVEDRKKIRTSAYGFTYPDIDSQTSELGKLIQFTLFIYLWDKLPHQYFRFELNQRVIINYGIVSPAHATFNNTFGSRRHASFI